MAVFSTNQVRHFYAVKAVGDAKLTKDSEEGTIRPVADNPKETLYFEYMSPGGLMRSDLIKKDSIVWVRHTPATDKSQNRPLKKATVVLNSDVNEGKVIPGQDYILRIVFRQFAGMSDEDVYIKYGIVHGTRAMSDAADNAAFYAAMKDSLDKNFSRELTKLLTFTSSAEGLVIEEVAQDWTLGIKQQTPVYFEVYPTTVTYDGEEVCWAMNPDDPTKAVKYEDSATTIPNSKALADLEYFCMGERGDIYRNVGWPNSIPTKYILDGNNKTGYDVLDIHYYYEGSGENPQKSEKDITIVAESEKMTALLEALKEAAGITPTRGIYS